MQVKSPLFSLCVTDWQMDGRTNRQSDLPSKVCTLKKQIVLDFRLDDDEDNDNNKNNNNNNSKLNFGANKIISIL